MHIDYVAGFTKCPCLRAILRVKLGVRSAAWVSSLVALHQNINKSRPIYIDMYVWQQELL